MALWQNLPPVMILACLLSSAVCALLRGKAARLWLLSLSAAICLCSALLLALVIQGDVSYVYKMGEVGAPFGNELRVGPLECVMGLTFSGVMLLSVLGGWRQIARDIAPHRQNLFCTMCCLLLTALLAMTYTNDLFTGYVFIEILTISACALIVSSGRGRSLFAATRYMIFNLVGSGLFLFGLSMLYCLTGELLFPQLALRARALAQGGYELPLYLSLLLMALGLGIKSALYPFHSWLPNAYANATPAASAMLSALISKAYIFLLIKIIYRMAGAELFLNSGLGTVLFLFACVGVIMGSVGAIREHSLRRMIAWSSVSQIGYIFLAASMGTELGAAAAVFHIIAHSCAKAMQFLSADRLISVSGGSEAFRDLRGSGFRAPLAGAAFAAGALSVSGVPIFAGFASKVLLCDAATALTMWKAILALTVMAVSTVLNVAYQLRTVLTLYRRGERFPLSPAREKPVNVAFILSMVVFIALNVLLGVCAGPVMAVIRRGLQLFN